MNTYNNSLSAYSTAIAQHKPLGIMTVVASLSIGGYIGLQLDQFLNIACAVRGTCYGEEGFIYSASLIHPMVFKLFFSALAMMTFSILIAKALPFDSMKTADLLDETGALNIKRLGSALFLIGGVFLLLSMPLMIYSLSV